MQPSRQPLTLPSGATCVIRKITPMDYVQTGRAFPNLYAQTKRRRAAMPAESEISPDDLLAGVELVKLALTRCCSALTWPDGAKRKIADKPFDQCTESEICVEELAQEDATAIWDAVQKLSGMTGEAAKKAATFPEATEAAGEPAPDGKIIRMPAHDDTPPAAG